MICRPKKRYCKSSLKHNQIFLYFIDNFMLNLVVYVYLRPEPAPATAPATSSRESRPATLRHSLHRGHASKSYS